MSIENKKKLRALCLVLFILYSISIVYFLIFSDMFGRGHGYEEMRYNLTPFLEIKRFVKYRSYMTTTSVMLNLVGNVLAFVPFGMLIRWVRGKKTADSPLYLSDYYFYKILYKVSHLHIFLPSQNPPVIYSTAKSAP